MLAPALDINRADNDFGTLRKMVGYWRSVADILLEGDYYPLTPPGRTGKKWVIWQFNRPGELDGEGGPMASCRLSGSVNVTTNG